MHPELAFTQAGMEPDDWQVEIVQSEARRRLVLCARGAGKTEAALVKVVRMALTQDGCLILVLAPSDRQSMEFLKRVKVHYNMLGAPMGSAIKATDHEWILSNGSRVIALPESERTIRIFQGVDMLVIDEASRVDEDLYHAVTPMLGVSGGSILALSTAFGQLGWFWTAWEKGGDDWERTEINAYESSRFAPGFLEMEKRNKPKRDFEREYLNIFHEGEQSVFRSEDINAAFGTNRPAFRF